jgi:hypothetical protein
VSDLTAVELIYLRSAAGQKWYSASPFELDKISLKLVADGYLTLDVYRNDWRLTNLGRSALRASNPVNGGKDGEV